MAENQYSYNWLSKVVSYSCSVHEPVLISLSTCRFAFRTYFANLLLYYFITFVLIIYKQQIYFFLHNDHGLRSMHETGFNCTGQEVITCATCSTFCHSQCIKLTVTDLKFYNVGGWYCSKCVTTCPLSNHVPRVINCVKHVTVSNYLQESWLII